VSGEGKEANTSGKTVSDAVGKEIQSSSKWWNHRGENTEGTMRGAEGAFKRLGE